MKSKKIISFYDRALSEAKKKRPDLEMALKLLERAHAMSDFRATYAIGTWYLHGKHVKRSIPLGTKYLKVASEHDVPSAVFDLAVSLEKGIGVKQNARKAAEHYLRAALLGEKSASYEVGRCYYYGIGFEKDRRVAKIWLREAEKNS